MPIRANTLITWLSAKNVDKNRRTLVKLVMSAIRQTLATIKAEPTSLKLAVMIVAMAIPTLVVVIASYPRRIPLAVARGKISLGRVATEMMIRMIRTSAVATSPIRLKVRS